MTALTNTRTTNALGADAPGEYTTELAAPQSTDQMEAGDQAV